MIPENSSPEQVWYGHYEGYELRSQRRLQKDLGIDETAVETILHLRSQVIELQTQIRQLEAVLAVQDASQQMHLARYQEAFSEAIWIELEFLEG
jgi:hypothetical protein